MTRVKNAFSLVELLVVVAVISLLAAIALPNFHSARVRAETARVQSDFGALANALEMYAQEHKRYPVSWTRKWQFQITPCSQRLFSLTTPTAYIAALPPDPFAEEKILNAFYEEEVIDGVNTIAAYDTYAYWDAWSAYMKPPIRVVWNCRLGEWRLLSLGPGPLARYERSQELHTTNTPYAASNGLYSEGSIMRYSGSTTLSVPCWAPGKSLRDLAKRPR